MERSSRKVKEAEVNAVLDFIFQNAMGMPIILSAVPTAAQMKANTWGVYDVNLYVKFGNNVLLRFTGTVIT